jgi:nitrogen regulatory protein PII
MKMIIAYIPPFMMEKVVKALQEIPEVPGASVTEVQGFGRGRGRKDLESLATEIGQSGTLRKLRIETMVPAAVADQVVEVIREAAAMGRPGNGKIYVVPLERAVKIRTGEEGDAGL